MNVKQVIAVRDDLGMNRGKIAAQAAHASMLFLFDGLRDRRSRTAAGEAGGSQAILSCPGGPTAACRRSWWRFRRGNVRAHSARP